MSNLEEFKRRLITLPVLGWWLRRAKAIIRKDPNLFLRHVKGVIHVGANTGQERDSYQDYGLRVLWVEPIPDIYKILADNIHGYPNQKAFQRLVTDKDDVEYQFNVANNGGQSSSILPLKLHKDLWPLVEYSETLSLKSTTLSSLFAKEGIDPTQYDALVMDTQGSELLVLTGAEKLLNGIKYIKTEVSDFDAYGGGCQLRDIQAFLEQRGYQERSRQVFGHHKDGGCYYNLVYERVA